MKKLALFIALLMITGALSTQSGTHTTVTQKVTVETVASKLDSIAAKAVKIKSINTQPFTHEN